MADKRPNVVIGVAKCPTTKKMYGVRIEIKDRNKWEATWAFPIKPDVAQREGYKENEFPADIEYGIEYLGCPYCQKHENLYEISKRKPKPKPLKIAVTTSGCDDIGSILSSMNINYSMFSSVGFNCDLLFVNCLTSDRLDETALRKFVEDGGCLYASCYADSLIKKAFPGVFNTDHSGSPHVEDVIVEDSELREVVGNRISVKFDTAWARMYSAKGSLCILRSTQLRKLPIMVSLKYGKGTIHFTCFHNHVQASEKEKALLQLLVLKQIGTNSNTSLEEAGEFMGVDVEKIKAKFKSNW